MTKDSGFQFASSSRPTRERVGLNVDGTNVADGTNAMAAVKTIVAAEAAGVRQIWTNQTPWSPDVLTTFAAAGSKNIYNTLRNVDRANLSTSSTDPGSAGSCFI